MIWAGIGAAQKHAPQTDMIRLRTICMRIRKPAEKTGSGQFSMSQRR